MSHHLQQIDSEVLKPRTSFAVLKNLHSYFIALKQKKSKPFLEAPLEFSLHRGGKA